MSAIVQATCPGCKHVLRIPAEWLAQAFKCKHCGMVIQARPKGAAAPATAAARPTARPPAPAEAPRPARPAAGEAFDFDEEPAGPTSRRYRRRRSRGTLTKALTAAGVLLLFAGAVYFTWPYLARILGQPGQSAGQTENPDDKDSEEPRPPSPKGSDLGPRRDSKGRADLPIGPGQLPRRALAISINNYLFANPINYGMPGPQGHNLNLLLERFSQRDGLRIPADQTALLSDAAPRAAAVPPTERVIRDTIENFVKTSRAQDRILLLIVGHVSESSETPALVPIDGEADAKEGGIPIKWIYDRLAECKARQKVLILDTCRLDPSKGQERPGSGPMGKKLDDLLKEPPAGVQVWSSCVAGQYSYEFEGGDIHNGLFLDVLFKVVEGISKGKIQSATDPFPLERLRDAVNAGMQDELGPLGKEQTSRLTGSEPEGGAEPDPSEPALKPVVARPPARPGGTADLSVVKPLLKDISFPPLKVAKDTKPLAAEALPPFPADTLKEYLKDGDKTPLRDEVMKARDLLNALSKHQLRDRYDAVAEASLKKQVKEDQTRVAKEVIAELMEESEALKAVADHRKDETKRWQANYDYVAARLEAQLAYLNEYQAVLGQILKGPAPLDPKFRGWRLASSPDPATGDAAAKKLASDARKKLDKIVKDYPDTPWAVLAKRDRASALGLEWQPTK
jgi:hypothetical protein